MISRLKGTDQAQNDRDINLFKNKDVRSRYVGVESKEALLCFTSMAIKAHTWNVIAVNSNSPCVLDLRQKRDQSSKF